MYKTLIVVDTEDSPLKDQFSDVVSFEKYFSDYPRVISSKTRIINLCDTGHYLSKGHYCSLLAEARNHVVLPSVKTINNLRNEVDLQPLIPLISDVTKYFDESAWIYFGKLDGLHQVHDQAQAQGLKAFAEKLFEEYPSPIIKLNISRDATESSMAISVTIELCTPNSLPENEQASFLEHLKDFTHNVWHMDGSAKRIVEKWRLKLFNAAES